MPLDPAIAAQVAHLVDATWGQVLRGEVAGAPAAAAMDRRDVDRSDGEVVGPGGPIPIRIYRFRSTSTQTQAATGLVPALVWAHGGGWQFGDLDMPEADSVAQMAAAAIGGVVVSVDYRLAPAHRHPAALDDVVAVAGWLRREAEAHGVDADRIALGGASAGAHLAALGACALRDGDETPAALLLVYPVTDPDGGPYGDRHPDCPPVLWLDHATTTGLFAGYVGDGAVIDPETAIPARRPLDGLPATLVATAECDALADQGEAFVDSLVHAGVDVTHHPVEGVLHGYANTVGDVDRATAAVDQHLAWLHDVLVRRS